MMTIPLYSSSVRWTVDRRLTHDPFAELGPKPVLSLKRRKYPGYFSNFRLKSLSTLNSTQTFKLKILSASYKKTSQTLSLQLKRDIPHRLL